MGSAPASASDSWCEPNPERFFNAVVVARSFMNFSNDASCDLVRLDRFEQRAEIALAEALVALALDDLEEDRPDHGLGEDLQELVLVMLLVDALAVDEDLVALEALEVLAVVGHALVDALVIGVGRVEEAHAPSAQRLHRRIDVRGRECDVLDALAVV